MTSKLQDRRLYSWGGYDYRIQIEFAAIRNDESIPIDPQEIAKNFEALIENHLSDFMPDVVIEDSRANDIRRLTNTLESLHKEINESVKQLAKGMKPQAFQEFVSTLPEDLRRFVVND